MNIGTTYMGLHLKSPLIAGSSGMTRNLETIREFEKYGIGAVVLKSLFEEQILIETKRTYEEAYMEQYPEAIDYIREYSEDKSVTDYLHLISESKKACSIPIIASINCNTNREWTEFAARIQGAGADGIELNIFILPSDPDLEGNKNEKTYFHILKDVKKHVSIPVSIKLSYYFSGLARFITKLSWEGPAALVLFNKFFAPDFDIENFRVNSTSIFSKPDDLFHSLRWVAMLSGRIGCDIASSTGVHDGTALIKQLLAGANAVQATSVFYDKGPQHAETMLEELKEWMKRHHFNTLYDFRGKLSYNKMANPAALERVQFMKYYSGTE